MYLEKITSPADVKKIDKKAKTKWHIIVILR